jgi:hypothetical protein
MLGGSFSEDTLVVCLLEGYSGGSFIMLIFGRRFSEDIRVAVFAVAVRIFWVAVLPVAVGIFG